jgi:SPP1 family phage portal protein
MLDFIDFLASKVTNLIWQGAGSRMSDKEFLEKEIARWKSSPQRIMQIKGHLYYDNEHDILKRRRTMIGEGGKLQPVDNLPNNRIIDNQYGKMVNQKANYLLGQPFVIESKNETYARLLKEVFNKRFMKLLKNGGKAALNGGIAWLYPYYTDAGELAFRLFPSYEILPFWKDSEHTMLDFAVRLYLVEGYEGTVPKLIEKVEVYDLQGIHKFILDGGVLIPDISTEKKNFDSSYVTVIEGKRAVAGLNWQKIPLIPLKYNEQEIPLIQRVKTLQDGINVMLSDFENNMQEDSRNTILVIKNYDGTDLGQFRHNLATFGAVKVRYDGETKGGVDTLEITVNAENYKAILEIFKKALIENAMGYDAKDDRLSGNPNQMNIQSMYSDIDLNANDMETELQAAFEEILWFVNVHLANTGQGDFEGEEVNIVFNRDMMMDEGQIIENIRNSVGILSNQTLVAQHPWIDDVETELKKIEEEKQKEQEELEQQAYNPFGQQGKQKEAGVADEEQ